MSFDIARTNEIKTIDKNITVTGKDKKKKRMSHFQPFSFSSSATTDFKVIKLAEIVKAIFTELTSN